jgi:hypothetical protein
MGSLSMWTPDSYSTDARALHDSASVASWLLTYELLRNWTYPLVRTFCRDFLSSEINRVGVSEGFRARGPESRWSAKRIARAASANGQNTLTQEHQRNRHKRGNERNAG